MHPPGIILPELPRCQGRASSSPQELWPRSCCLNIPAICSHLCFSLLLLKLRGETFCVPSLHLLLNRAVLLLQGWLDWQESRGRCAEMRAHRIHASLKKTLLLLSLQIRNDRLPKLTGFIFMSRS